MLKLLQATVRWTPMLEIGQTNSQELSWNKPTSFIDAFSLQMTRLQQCWFPQVAITVERLLDSWEWRPFPFSHQLHGYFTASQLKTTSRWERYRVRGHTSIHFALTFITEVIYHNYFFQHVWGRSVKHTACEQCVVKLTILHCEKIWQH